MKNNHLEYKGYRGTVEVELDDDCLHGQVEHIKDLVTYQADTHRVLKKEFEIAVDDYLNLCLELGRKADKPFKNLDQDLDLK